MDHSHSMMNKPNLVLNFSGLNEAVNKSTVIHSLLKGWVFNHEPSVAKKD